MKTQNNFWFSNKILYSYTIFLGNWTHVLAIKGLPNYDQSKDDGCGQDRFKHAGSFLLRRNVCISNSIEYQLKTIQIFLTP